MLEIAAILDGSISKSQAVTYTIQKDTTVQIAVPANPPKELLAELSKLFQTMRVVREAYIALINNPEDGRGPQTLIAIDVSDDWERVMATVGMVANAVKIPDPPLDVIQLNTSKGLSLKLPALCKPFYTRKMFRLH